TPASRWSATCPTPWTPPPRSPTRAGWAAPSWPPARSTRPPRSGCSWASRPPDPQPTERLDSTPPNPHRTRHPAPFHPHRTRHLARFDPTGHADRWPGPKGRRRTTAPGVHGNVGGTRLRTAAPATRPYQRVISRARFGASGAVWGVRSRVGRRDEASGRVGGVKPRRPVGWEASSRGARSGEGGHRWGGEVPDGGSGRGVWQNARRCVRFP